MEIVISMLMFWLGWWIGATVSRWFRRKPFTGEWAAENIIWSIPAALIYGIIKSIWFS